MLFPGAPRPLKYNHSAQDEANSATGGWRWKRSISRSTSPGSAAVHARSEVASTQSALPAVSASPTAVSILGTPPRAEMVQTLSGAIRYKVDRLDGDMAATRRCM